MVKSVLKRSISFADRSRAIAGLVSLLEQTGDRRPNLLRVLTYHRVDEHDARPTLSPRETVAPATFATQMEHLATNYHVVSVAEVLDACRSATSLPPRSVMVTFDDAYHDFAEYAWPILQRYKLPVTLFVPTAFPDRPERIFWWDRLYHALALTPRRNDLHTPAGRLPLSTLAQRENAFTRLRGYAKTLPHGEAIAWVEALCRELDVPPPAHAVLGWDALRQLAREGVTLGAHTRTHPMMNRVSLAEARAEAVGSLRDLEREIGSVPPIFAYPSGGVTGEVVEMLDREGFALAFTTERGINDLRRADRLRLRRINVGRRTGLTVLRAQLLPWSISTGGRISLPRAKSAF